MSGKAALTGGFFAPCWGESSRSKNGSVQSVGLAFIFGPGWVTPTRSTKQLRAKRPVIPRRATPASSPDRSREARNLPTRVQLSKCGEATGDTGYRNDCILPPVLHALWHLSSLPLGALARTAMRVAHCTPVACFLIPNRAALIGRISRLGRPTLRPPSVALLRRHDARFRPHRPRHRQPPASSFLSDRLRVANNSLARP
jgi:hypothetical protein